MQNISRASALTLTLLAAGTSFTSAAAHAAASAQLNLTGFQYVLSDLDPSDGVDPSLSLVLGPRGYDALLRTDASAVNFTPEFTQDRPNTYRFDAPMMALPASALVATTADGQAQTVVGTNADGGFMTLTGTHSGDGTFGGAVNLYMGTDSLFSSVPGDGLLLAPHTRITVSAQVASDAHISGLCPDGVGLGDACDAASAAAYLELSWLQADGSSSLMGDKLSNALTTTELGQEVDQAMSRQLQVSFSNDSDAVQKIGFRMWAQLDGRSVPLALGVVPEPSAWALMALGLIGLGAVARRQRT